MTHVDKRVAILIPVLFFVLFSALIPLRTEGLDAFVHVFVSLPSDRFSPRSTIQAGQQFDIVFSLDTGYSGVVTVYFRASSSSSYLWQSGGQAADELSGGTRADLGPPYVTINDPGNYVAGLAVQLDCWPGYAHCGTPPSPAIIARGEFPFSVIPSSAGLTDWAVSSVSLNPAAPNVGDQVTLSGVITAVSSTGSFPQSVEVNCQIDTENCGTGTVSYPGPVGVPFTVTSDTRWIATPGGHTLVWTIITSDLNPSNNMVSLTFTVAQAPQQQFDFSISASPSTQTINPGGSTTYTVTVNLLSGSPQSVTLSLVGAPGGVSGSFNPTSGTSLFTSTLTVSAAMSVTPGSYMLTVTGSGGGVQHTTTVTLTVSQVPDFQVNASPSSQTVLQGQTVSYSVNVVALNGFNSQVSLMVSGLPSGASGVFSVSSGTPNFASTLTVTLPTSVPSGSFTLTITGSGGGLTRTANVLLAVNPAQTQSLTTTTQTTSPAAGGLLETLQQNSLIIIVALVVLVILFGALAMRGRGRRAVPQQIGAQRMFCSKCGTENLASNEFCASCGNKLRSS